MAEDFLPFDVVEAAISAMGKAFYYKSGLRALFRRCGVAAPWFDRYANETKYAIARHVFADLETRGEQGRAVALRIISELCTIRKISDDKVDQKSALAALDELRRLSREARIANARDEVARDKRLSQHKEQLEKLTLREKTLADCLARFNTLLRESDAQKRGYALEQLLKDLFNVHEISYRPSYRSDAEQIDGAFRYESFDYLTETKWTRNEATLSALDTFRAKVSRKLSSTRGLFLSMAGFDDKIVSQFESGPERNVILMDGEDLALILEQRMSLTDALDLKTSQAAHKGRLLIRLRDNI